MPTSKLVFIFYFFVFPNPNQPALYYKIICPFWTKIIRFQYWSILTPRILVELSIQLISTRLKPVRRSHIYKCDCWIVKNWNPLIGNYPCTLLLLKSDFWIVYSIFTVCSELTVRYGYLYSLSSTEWVQLQSPPTPAMNDERRKLTIIFDKFLGLWVLCVGDRKNNSNMVFRFSQWTWDCEGI